MKELKKTEDLQKIKKSDFSCLFFYAEGCPHCEDAKPIYEKLSKQMKDVDFFKLNAGTFPDVMDFYQQYAEFEQERETVMHDDQPLIVDGNVITKPVFNDDGTPKMTPVVSIPIFYIFAKSEIDEEDDEYGFVGKINGNMPEKLESVLKMFKEKLK